MTSAKKARGYVNKFCLIGYKYYFSVTTDIIVTIDAFAAFIKAYQQEANTPKATFKNYACGFFTIIYWHFFYKTVLAKCTTIQRKIRNDCIILY